MPLLKDEIAAAALKLPPSDRADLASRLIDSLDEIRETEGDVEAAWVEEAERRYAEYRKGLVTARDSDEVFRDARRRLE